MTAVEWLKNELWEKFNFSFSDNIFEQAKEMEKQQIELSYEEMRKAAINYNKKTPHNWENEASFIDGARWYREQLKNKQ